MSGSAKRHPNHVGGLLPHAVGRALLAAIEAWATAQRYRFLTRNVFAGNRRARAVHERAGYEPDTIRYVKELPSPALGGRQ